MAEILGKVPKSPKQLKEEQDASVASSLNRIKNKFVVMSGKGGVGKTSTAVNIAITLANRGFQVGIMDVDLHGPDVPRMLGLSGMPDLNSNRKLNPMRYSDHLVAISMESFLPERDDAIIWRGPLKFSAIRQFIADVEWGELDFLIIDSPPGTGDEPLTVAQQIQDAKAVIVTTPQEVALADVRKSINFCRSVNLEMFGLVENMSGLNCPHCGESIDLFGAGGGERTAKETGIAFLGRIPMDPRMVACGDSGVSFQTSYPDSPVTQAFGAIADKMVQPFLSGR
jgi:Mrp family chromosome partitioning ATPase